MDLAAAVRDHRASGALATMVLLPMPPGTRYAAVEMDGGGAVRRIAGAFGPGGEGLSPWHFSGVHVLSPRSSIASPPSPFERDINRHVYPPLMASGAVLGRVVEGTGTMLGTPARYLDATFDVLSGRVPPARFPGADPFAGTREIAHGVRAAASARVDGSARLVGPSLVCEDAVVGRAPQSDLGRSSARARGWGRARRCAMRLCGREPARAGRNGGEGDRGRGGAGRRRGVASGSRSGSRSTGSPPRARR